MSHCYCLSIKIIFIILTLFLLSILTDSLSITNRISSKKNDATLLLERFGNSGNTKKLRNITGIVRDHLKPTISHDEFDEELDNQAEEDNLSEHDHDEPQFHGDGNVVVLTSLSGIYVWWPSIFGGDDSFHLLLSQEDVPRFHDVTGDESGHIYLTAPHERTVYRLQYSNGWWISNFSNHTVMNSIRNEMPLFLTLHHVSSILYVYGHSDIQTIDLFERSGTRGSAPFMKRLRELSPNLRISDLIIDQLTSDGYVIGDSYGWCTVIRCSLTATECTFLFKIPSSYDNRPYPCTATIDFSTKIIYLSLEEKILGVHLNEQTNYDRRIVVTEKKGPRSTLGYDDIVTYNQTILYTDVLRPLLHICQSTNSYSCINMSLAFSPPQRPILPLRLTIVKVQNFRPPPIEDEETDNEDENSSDDDLEPISSIDTNRTSTSSGLIADQSSIDSNKSSNYDFTGIWMLIFGIVIGLVFSSIVFIIFYFTWKESEGRVMDKFTPFSKRNSTFETQRTKSFSKGYFLPMKSESKTSSDLPSSDVSGTHLLDYSGSSSIASSSVQTATTSSSSYQPDIIL